MNELQKYFLAESISRLRQLQQNLDKDFSEKNRRAAFRVIHTIKGTAQTFGLRKTARLAHDLEQSFAAEFDAAEKTKKNLLENIEVLIVSFAENDEKDASFSSQKPNANESQTANRATDDFFGLSADLVKKLSEQEKKLLKSAIAAGKNIFRAEVEFEPIRLSADYKTFREILDENGDVIAALPGKKGAPGKISFNIYFASREKADFLQKSVENFFAAVIAEKVLSDPNFGVREVLTKIIAHGKSIAEKLGKDIEFTVAADSFPVPAETLGIIFESLLHLVRNAADHGIERRGSVEVAAKTRRKEIVLTIKDDGEGIDAEKILAAAAEKQIVSGSENLTREEIINLIFESGFSTARQVSEVSGRGVGLDAVKNLIENAGGRISVKSEKGKGTTFEIFLPNEN